MGTKMYFIQEGVVDVISKENEILTSLSDGSYFGGIFYNSGTPKEFHVGTFLARQKFPVLHVQKCPMSLKFNSLHYKEKKRMVL